MDPLRALALAGILLNHLVEAFGAGPWFTNPGLPRPPLADRLYDFVPHDHSPLVATIRTLGWLGDAAPGVFILLSGLGLTLSALRDPERFAPRAFYKRRLLRIFPLYVALHFVVLGAAVLVPGDQPTFASWKTLASLAGLRLRPGLFTYIVPAWWFVWLMLQLYAVYPLLWRALRRFGPARFFAGCVVLTVLARAAVLAANVNVFASMTGMFFETRLAEFAAGMVLADWIVRNRTRPRPQRAAVPELTLIAALTYLAGLAASMVMIGTLVSSLLVTLGMTGLFYGAWRLLLAPVPAVARGVTWLGGAAYAVFLLHQPFLLWTAIPFGRHPGVHLLAAIGVILLSLPAAIAIERGVGRIERVGPDLVRRHVTALALGGAATVAALLLVAPIVPPGGRLSRALAFGVAAGVAGLAAAEWCVATRRARLSAAARVFERTGLVAGFLALFVLHLTAGPAALVAGAALAVAIAIAARWLPQPGRG
jgi:peptidoglycan/LPS O-acetylase OafA/YrhL